MSDYPIGKAQQMVLDALGVKRGTFAGAAAYFAEIGIVVSSKRVGRNSVPVVRIKDRYAAGVTEEGEGETWRAYDDLTAEQRQSLAPWIEGEKMEQYRDYQIEFSEERGWIGVLPGSGYLPWFAPTRESLIIKLDTDAAERAFRDAHQDVHPGIVLKARDPGSDLNWIGGGPVEEWELPEVVDEALFRTWLDAWRKLIELRKQESARQ